MKTIADTLDVSRSNLYEKPAGARRNQIRPDDARYVTLIRMVIDNRPTYGYRRVTALINRTLTERGQPRVNHKRI